VLTRFQVLAYKKTSSIQSSILLDVISIRAVKPFCVSKISLCCLGVVSGARGVWIRTLLLRSESCSTV